MFKRAAHPPDRVESSIIHPLKICNVDAVAGAIGVG